MSIVSRKENSQHSTIDAAKLFTLYIFPFSFLSIRSLCVYPWCVVSYRSCLEGIYNGTGSGVENSTKVHSSMLYVLKSKRKLEKNQ